ncbi:signal peptidase I [Halocatena halophila]|uniref:signal peptidase I n=1 Tax=Halocatena halophila TaxID=2814576 RepID=UPI002ED66229
MDRRLLGATAQSVLVLVLVAVVIGQLIGQPVLLAYVTSNSMEDTISTGDGFIVLPAVVTGEPEEGDIIVFNSKTLNDDAGGITTHRVEETTNEGLITRGDNNPFTDQDAGEPPVKDRQVIGEAVMIGSQPIVIPHLGSAFGAIRGGISNIQRQIAIALGTRSLLGTQGLAYILLGFGILLYAGSALFESGGNRSRRRRRKRSRKRRITNTQMAIVLGLVLVGSLTATMTFAGGIQEFSVVSAQYNSPGPTVIASGETESMNYTVPNGGVLPMQVYLDPAGNGVSTPDDSVIVGPGETQTMNVDFSVPDETGYYPRYVAEHRYLTIIPPSLIDLLYRIHPWLPVIVIDSLVFVAFLAVTTKLLGRGYVRSRPSRSRFVRRIKRLLKY